MRSDDAAAGRGLLRMEAVQVALPAQPKAKAMPTYPDDEALPLALDRLSLAIDRGESFALVGESGCGKSMTALSLLRLLPEGVRLQAGSAVLAGRDLFALPEASMQEVRGRRIGIIFQEPSTSLNPVMRIGAQLREVISRHAALRDNEVRVRALEWLGRVGLADPEACMQAWPFELSGGQKQRAMIAMALAAEPGLLIADEPTTALDVSLQAQIMALLRTLQRERGMAMLLITHDLALVAEMADHLALMYAGQIVESAPAAAFFAQPIHPYGRLLLQALPKASERGRRLAAIEGRVPDMHQRFAGCRFAPRCPWAILRCQTEAPAFQLAEGSIAAQVRAAPSDRRGPSAQRDERTGVRCHRRDEVLTPSPAVAPGAAPSRATGEEPSRLPSAGATRGKPARALLAVQSLRVVYQRGRDEVIAVRDIDLQLFPGETLALVGESGCGKTTVGRALMQLLPEDARVSGAAHMHSLEGNGQVLRAIPADARAARRIRAQMQMIFQDPFASLDPRMRIHEVLEEGMLALCPQWGRGERRERLEALLVKVGLPHDALERYPHEFSGGQRQRIAIARALAVEPRILICDEPTSALDVSVQAQILNLLSLLREELGLSMLFITHNLGVVEYLADRVVVMQAGVFVEQGEAQQLLAHPQHPYTKALLNAVPRISIPQVQARSARVADHHSS